MIQFLCYDVVTCLLSDYFLEMLTISCGMARVKCLHLTEISILFATKHFMHINFCESVWFNNCDTISGVVRDFDQNLQCM